MDWLNRLFRRPAQNNAQDIINKSTNWGQAAQNLRNAGINPTQYDAQLKGKFAQGPKLSAQSLIKGLQNFSQGLQHNVGQNIQQVNNNVVKPFHNAVDTVHKYDPIANVNKLGLTQIPRAINNAGNAFNNLQGVKQIESVLPGKGVARFVNQNVAQPILKSSVRLGNAQTDTNTYSHDLKGVGQAASDFTNVATLIPGVGVARAGAGLGARFAVNAVPGVVASAGQELSTGNRNVGDIAGQAALGGLFTGVLGSAFGGSAKKVVQDKHPVIVHINGQDHKIFAPTYDAQAIANGGKVADNGVAAQNFNPSQARKPTGQWGSGDKPLNINNPLGAKTDGSLTINNPGGAEYGDHLRVNNSLDAKTGPEINNPLGVKVKGEPKINNPLGAEYKKTSPLGDGINPINDNYTGPIKLPKAKTETKSRGFVETIIKDPSTDPQIKSGLSSLYKVRNTKELQTKAANFAADYPNATRAIAGNVQDDKSLAIASSHWASEQARAATLRSSGDTVGANGILDEVLGQQAKAAENLTKAGQFAQAASVYGKTTPEGILRFTQNEIAKYNEAMGTKLKLPPEEAARLVEQSSKIQSMAEGRAKQVEIQKLLKQVADIMPPTWTQRAATLQTMAQLLNPKTLIRNVGGNTIFGGMDNISQTLAAPLDKLVSAVRGSERSVGLPSLRRQFKAAKVGLKEGSSEAWQGISLGPQTQFDLNKNPVFKGKILGTAERGMGVVLQGPDRAAYKAAYEDTLQGLMKANKVTKPTQQMLDQADYTGLYRTFQDDSAAARLFTSMKGALNHIGITKNGHAFGLGDFILKYPKTPANLLSRGIDYSPAGIVKGLFEIAKPAFSKKPFDQAAFVNGISRGIVGSAGLVGAGSILGKIGIITPKPEQNKDLRNIQKTAGLGGYQINTSALKRYLLSGFNASEAKLQKGDTLVSYDWAQPLAIPISAGASIGKGQGVAEGAKKSAGAFAEGINTLVEQPLVTGMLNFSASLKQKGIGGAIGDVAAGAPSSFVPTGVSQINQLMDNTQRNTFSPGLVGSGINQVKAKIPGLAQSLPASIDVLGNQKQRYQDNTNNVFNVLFNPAFVSKYKPSATAETSLGLYQKTGETKQAPNTVSNKVTINGKNVTMTGDQQGQFQQYVGQNAVKVFDQLSKDPSFNSLPDTQKVNILSNLQTDLNTAAKIQLLGDQPGKVSKSVQSILESNLNSAIAAKVENQLKANQPPKGKKPKKTRIAKGRRVKIKTARLVKIKTGKIKGIKAPRIRTTNFKSKTVRIPKTKSGKKITLSA